MLWQLKNLKTGEALNDPQKLPENWGPIFGMSGFVDRLGDLSWLGPNYENQGWFVVGEAPPDPEPATEDDLVLEQVQSLLKDSEWSMLPDAPITIGQKEQWIKYRDELRYVHLQVGFPSNVIWPQKPE